MVSTDAPSLPPTSSQENAEAPPPSPEDSHHASAPPPLVASISFSLSTLLSLSVPKSSSPPLSALPSKVRIPSQISSVALSSTSAISRPSRSATRCSAISASPLHSPLGCFTRRPAEPSHPAAGRRCTVVWFRNDLRVHDNEALTLASNDSLSVLPVYLFDPRDYGKSSSGFDRTGPYRASFLLESVRDLRSNLRARGSDLVVRVGRPETVLVELARAVGADAVYAHQEVSHDEVRTEERVGKAMEEEGVEVKYFWGSTLYHIEDLPFDLEQMPTNYGGFREKVQGLGIRKTIEGLDQLKGVPTRGDVEPGEIPSLMDLGLTTPSTMGQEGKPVTNSCLVGGETEALDRLKKFAVEFGAQPNKGGKDGSCGSIYGANFSCKISPWLATGCLSPRYMFDELKKNAKRMVSAAATQSNGKSPSNNGTHWLMFELMWRDFFRFITKKYSSNKRKVDAVPATACTGALV